LADLVQSVSERQLATERQLSELSSALKALQAQVAELGQAAVSRAVAPKVAAPAASGAVQPKNIEVTPEILVVLAAATTVFLGKEVRIRSAKMLQSPYEVINPWSQQGRVFVMASHNLRSSR
jgi:methylmalonyl-CoA carboxyltransferase large subunit